MYRFFCFLFFVLISFFSCSNGAELHVQEPEEEVKTLKKIISGKESNVSWTGELEGDRLYFDVYRDSEHVSSEVALTPAVVNVAGGYGDAVYPELIGFCSLDIRALPDDLNIFVNDFGKAFCKDVFQGPEKFLDDRYVFNYVFFKNDLVRDWKKFFGNDFPQNSFAEGKTFEVSEGILSTAATATSTAATATDSVTPTAPDVFTSYRLGQPVITTEIIQQPMRFYCNKKFCNQGYVDFVLFIRLDNKKIYQISRGVFGR